MNDNKLSKDLLEVSKQIVKYCNKFLLCLIFIRSFLEQEKKLRCGKKFYLILK